MNIPPTNFFKEDDINVNGIVFHYKETSKHSTKGFDHVHIELCTTLKNKKDEILFSLLPYKCKLDIINSYIRNLDFIYDCMYKVLTSNESKLQDLEILGKMYMVMYHQIDPLQV